MYQYVKDHATRSDLIASANVDTDFPIGTYSSNRFSIGDRKTFKTPLYKGKIKFRKKKCPIVQIATIGHYNR